MYAKISVPRPSTGTSPGAYKAKKPNVTIVDADDVLTFPGRDSKGVNETGNYVLKTGAKMIQIYMTPETIEASYESEGPEDGKVFKQMFKGDHPGDELAIREFVQNWLGVPVIIFEENCRNATMNVYGTACSPLKLNPSFTSNKEGTKTTLTFEQPNPVEYVPGYYTGALTYADAHAEADENLALAVADGNVYQLAAFAAGESLDIASIDHADGAIISLIGGGGTDPATLAAGAATAATVILKDGAAWTALEDAVINLEVLDGGATIYLSEVSRK